MRLACFDLDNTLIDRDGAFVMTENHGLFTCRD